MATPATYAMQSGISLGGITAQGVRPTTVQASGQKQIAETAEKFEAMFITQMFQCMFEGLDADPMFGGGHAENMFRSLLLDEYGKQVAQRGGIGIAENVSRVLLAAQEGRA